MTLEDIKQLVKGGESETVEFKESTGQRGEACRTLCAFLNKRGGTVVFGVTRKGKLTGQLMADSTKRDLFETVSTTGTTSQITGAVCQITGTRWRITGADPLSLLPRMRRDARENAERVLHEIIADSNATLPQICARTGMALRTINNAIATLRTAGIIIDSTNGATHEPANEPINGPINGPITQRVLQFVRSHPGCKQADIAQGVGVALRTLKRLLSGLTDEIEYRGSKKTGGYYLR